MSESNEIVIEGQDRDQILALDREVRDLQQTIEKAQLQIQARQNAVAALRFRLLAKAGITDPDPYQLSHRNDVLKLVRVEQPVEAPLNRKERRGLKAVTKKKVAAEALPAEV